MAHANPITRNESVIRTLLATAVVLAVGGLAATVGCGGSAGDSAPSLSISADETAFIDTLQARTFRYFWDRCNPQTGLAPDRWPTESFASVAATGFALTAYPIGAERGWVSRAAAADRVLRTLRFLRTAPQGPDASGVIGHHGLFYHFVDPGTGERFGTVELSTVDTALLLAGALFCQSYFDGADGGRGQHPQPGRVAVPGADWHWASVRPPTIGHGWDPERGHLPYDWRGYNEAMLLYILALGSPTHPVAAEAWAAWTAGYRWGDVPGAGAPRLRAPLRPPVHATSGSTCAASATSSCARTDSTTSRTPGAPCWPSTPTRWPIPPVGRATGRACGG